MSVTKQKELIEKSINLGESIPGLNVDTIIESMVKKSPEVKAQTKIIENEVKENIDRGMSEQDAKAEAKTKIKNLNKSYKTSIKEAVIEQIAIITQQYKIFKEGLKRIPDDVKAAIANIAIPPTISTPPAGPNPVYATNLVKTTKNALLATLAIMIVAFTTMLVSGNKIQFIFPNSLLSLFDAIKTTQTIINSIPV